MGRWLERIDRQAVHFYPPKTWWNSIWLHFQRNRSAFLSDICTMEWHCFHLHWSNLKREQKIFSHFYSLSNDNCKKYSPLRKHHQSQHFAVSNGRPFHHHHPRAFDSQIGCMGMPKFSILQWKKTNLMNKTVMPSKFASLSQNSTFVIVVLVQLC